jgi:hypothetical protein
MTTLTASTGWTSTDNKYIITKITASNSDSSASAQNAGTSTESIKYYFVPTLAPTIALNAKTDDNITLTVTCLSDLTQGRFPGTVDYKIEYKLQTASTWTNHSVIACTTDSTNTTTITSLDPVSFYEFRIHASHAIGDGPTTASADYLNIETYGISG